MIGPGLYLQNFFIKHCSATEYHNKQSNIYVYIKITLVLKSCEAIQEQQLTKSLILALDTF